MYSTSYIRYIIRDGADVVINGRRLSHEEAKAAWAYLGAILRDWDEEYSLIFDWRVLPAWDICIAQDSNHRWYSYSKIPTLDSYENQWMPTAGMETEIPEIYWPRNFRGTWKESLMMRPGEEQ